jgi:hypothetical protein
VSDADLVAAAVEASGLSSTEFARLTGRDARSIRRWLAGGTIPPEARDWLRRWLALSASRRATITRALTADAPG